MTSPFNRLRLLRTSPVLYSALETVAIASTDRRVEYVTAGHFEAPNCPATDRILIFNQDGTLRRLTLRRNLRGPVCCRRLRLSRLQLRLTSITIMALLPNGTWIALQRPSKLRPQVSRLCGAGWLWTPSHHTPQTPRPLGTEVSGRQDSRIHRPARGAVEGASASSGGGQDRTLTLPTSIFIPFLWPAATKCALLLRAGP